jgi:hypothetical protein
MDITRAPDAPMAAGDPTRVHAVRSDDRVLLPGLTRPEAEAACEWLRHVPPGDRPLALAEVTLPVVLTDGAGPHLLDADGGLVLALAPHPSLAGARVAMGAPSPRHAVGLVRPLPGGGWLWMARVEVDEADRVPALDALDAVTDAHGAEAWAAVRAGAVPSLWP